jgi:dihydroxynaphthoic acid synthetase
MDNRPGWGGNLPINAEEAAMEYEDILYEAKEGIAKIIINRPKVYNAFRGKTMDELIHAFDRAETDESVGVVILSGAGEKAFCSGGDISVMGKLTPSIGRAWLGKCLKLSNTMRWLSKPIIAAVNGYCLGGGNELNVLCDMTIASETAVFGQVGPTVGSSPIWWGIQLLPRIVGEKKAREMVFLCQRYSAHEAERMGLCNKVVPADKLMKEAEAWAKRILEMSPQAIKIARASFNHALDLLMSSSYAGSEMLGLTYGGAELGEGMNAFLEKRRPDFNKFRRRNS